MKNNTEKTGILIIDGVYIGECTPAQFAEIITNDTAEKPPLGVIPKKVARALYLEKRRDELVSAMARYTLNFKAIPLEWIEEYNEIIKEVEANDGK